MNPARERFLAAGHKEALLLTKSVDVTGKAVQTVLHRLQKPFLKRKMATSASIPSESKKCKLVSRKLLDDNRCASRKPSSKSRYTSGLKFYRSPRFGESIEDFGPKITCAANNSTEASHEITSFSPPMINETVISTTVPSNQSEFAEICFVEMTPLSNNSTLNNCA